MSADVGFFLLVLAQVLSSVLKPFLQRLASKMTAEVDGPIE
jgi:hypothetical protein